MKVLKLLSLTLGVGLSSLAGSVATDLRCESQIDPIGLDCKTPRLSWSIRSEARDVQQTAYRILVASSREMLARDEGDLWDSARVVSDQSRLIEYAGAPLKAQQRYFWKVKVWTGEVESEQWSEVGQWTMAFLSPDDWTARWIAMPVNQISEYAKWIWSVAGKKPTSLPPGPCRFLRMFELPANAMVVDAKLMVTADNSVKLALNGQLVAESTNWEDGVLVDVKDHLVRGSNTLDVLATNGGSKNGPAGMILHLRVEFEDGNEISIVSDREWSAGLGENPENFSAATEIKPWGEGPWGERALFLHEKKPFELGLPVFRKSFELEKDLERALVHVAGLGQYELFVNGQKAGDDFLAAPWSVYEETVYYNTYDIADLLHFGVNELKIMLGKGFYNTRGDRRVHGVRSQGRLMAILEARLDYVDGHTEMVVTDDTWEAGAGPVMHSAILAGSDYDARIAEPLVWAAASEADATGILRSAESPPMKKFERLVPVKPADESEPGIFVYDFGVNLSAIPSVTLRGQKGQTIRLTPAEQRHGQTDRYNNGTGRVNQAGVGSPNYYEYTLGSDGPESWEPQFTYGGFQYLELAGGVPAGAPNPEGLPVVERVESVHVRSSAREVGSFACSNPLFMKIDQSIDRAVRSNLAHVLTDCPTREKLGWLEVAYLMGPSISRRYDVSRLYAKITRDIRESQGDDGAIYTVAPLYPRFKGGFRYTPEWGAAGVILPWQLYRWYGDRRVLEDNLATMKAFVDYMKDTGTGLVPKAGLGDWFDYGHGERSGPAKFTPPELTAMATYYRCAVIVADTAELLDETNVAASYRKLAANIRTRFNEEFYVGDGEYKNNGSCQTANAMALVLGLCEPENEQAVLDAMVADLIARDYQQTAGDIGFHYLVEALGTYGKNEVLFKNMNRHEEGSYGFIIDRGWTALPEAWDANTRVSMNHCMLGHGQQWFYADVLGIRQADDSVAFKKIVIKPAFETELEWARGHYDSASGPIAVDWNQSQEQLSLSIQIPANTTATVYVPASDHRSVSESGHKASQAHGVEFLRMEDGRAVFQVASGSYAFTSTAATGRR